MSVNDTGKELNRKVAKSQIVLVLLLLLIIIILLVNFFIPP